MKQRLVGTLVLGSLALILIPLLLDGEGVERPPLSVTTPPAPIIDTTPLPEPTRPQILADTFDSVADTEMPVSDSEPADSEQAADSSAPPEIVDTAPAASASADTAAVSTTAPDTANANAAPAAAQMPEAEPPSRSISTPALDDSGLPETWAVRVGVFSNANNARRLEERLKTDAYKAFVRPLGVSSAVYIGPLTTRDEATAIQQQLNAAKSKYQIDGVSVQRYDIGQQ